MWVMLIAYANIIYANNPLPKIAAFLHTIYASLFNGRLRFS